jgi:hypothetical protein
MVIRTDVFQRGLRLAGVALLAASFALPAIAFADPGDDPPTVEITVVEKGDEVTIAIEATGEAQATETATPEAGNSF